MRVNRKELLAELTQLSRVVAGKTVVPILSCVYLDRVGDTLGLRGTSLDAYMSCMVDGSGNGEVRGVVRHALLKRVVAAMESERVAVTTGKRWLKVSGGGFSAELPMWDRETPDWPDVKQAEWVEVGQGIMARLARAVQYVVHDGGSRFALNAARFEYRNTRVRAVATDGHRLVVTQSGRGVEVIPGELFRPREGLIVAEALRVLVHMGGGLPWVENDTDKVGWFDDWTVFRVGRRTLICREPKSSKFPNYESVIPNEYSCEIEFEAGAMEAALRRMLTVLSLNCGYRVVVDATEAGVGLSAEDSELGRAKEIVAAKVEGDPVRVLFNAQYLLEFVSRQSGPVRFRLRSPEHQGMMLDESGDTRYVVMPMMG